MNKTLRIKKRIADHLKAIDVSRETIENYYQGLINLSECMQLVAFNNECANMDIDSAISECQFG